MPSSPLIAALLVAVLSTQLPPTIAQSSPPCIAPCFNVVYLTSLIGNPAPDTPAYNKYEGQVSQALASNPDIRTYFFARPYTPPITGPPYFPFNFGNFFTFTSSTQYQTFRTNNQKNPVWLESNKAVLKRPVLSFQAQVGAPAPQFGAPCAPSCFSVVYVFNLTGNPSFSSPIYKAFVSLVTDAYSRNLDVISTFVISPSYVPAGPGTTIFTPFNVGALLSFGSPDKFAAFRRATASDPVYIAATKLQTGFFVVSFKVGS